MATAPTPTRSFIRAKPSTIASRSAPSVPAPSQSFDPQIKASLRARLTRTILPYSAAFSWAVSVLWVSWSQSGAASIGIVGTLYSLVEPAVFLLAFSTWALGALPVIVLRKKFISPLRTASTSPSTTMQAALSKPSTSRALVVYSIAAVALACVHAFVVSATQHAVHGDARLRVFVKSKKHPYYLNGRFLFLVFSQVVLANVYLLRNVLLDRFAFRWNAPKVNQKQPFSLSDLTITFLTVGLLSSLALPISLLAFASARFFLPVLFKIPLLSPLLRPFSAHFLRGRWTIVLPLRHWALLVRAWFLELTTLATWEFADLLFDKTISQPIEVTDVTTMISGLTSADSTHAYSAYHNLASLASSEGPSAASSRSALFSDQRYTPTLWQSLARSSLVLLGQDYQHLLRRGAPAPQPLAATAAPMKSLVPTETISTPTKLIHRPIFRTNKAPESEQVLDAVAADGPLSHGVEAAVPDLFRSVSAIPAPAVVAAAKPAVEEAVNKVKRVNWNLTSLVGFVWRTWENRAPANLRQVSNTCGEWWRRERLSRVVDGCFPRRELDVLAIEVLSHLTCASLTEDRYGVVQRDIPKILEAMLSFLSAIEEYQIEVAGHYVAPNADEHLSHKEAKEKERLRLEVEKSGETLGVVGDALKQGISRIVRTFGDKLSAFKFPPKTAKKLQGFLDYA